jgi:hypothetical protein
MACLIIGNTYRHVCARIATIDSEVIQFERVFSLVSMLIGPPEIIFRRADLSSECIRQVLSGGCPFAWIEENVAWIARWQWNIPFFLVHGLISYSINSELVLGLPSLMEPRPIKIEGALLNPWECSFLTILGQFLHPPCAPKRPSYATSVYPPIAVPNRKSHVLLLRIMSAKSMLFFTNPNPSHSSHWQVSLETENDSRSIFSRLSRQVHLWAKCCDLSCGNLKILAFGLWHVARCG